MPKATKIYRMRQKSEIQGLNFVFLSHMYYHIFHIFTNFVFIITYPDHLGQSKTLKAEAVFLK
jgi:hypothetical protein